MTTKRFTSALTIFATLATMGFANMATVSAAHATDNRHAYGACIDSARCAGTLGADGSFDGVVLTDEGVKHITCPPGATSECSVVPSGGGSGGHPSLEITPQSDVGPMSTTVLGEPKVSTAPTAGPVRTVRMGRGLQ